MMEWLAGEGLLAFQILLLAFEAVTLSVVVADRFYLRYQTRQLAEVARQERAAAIAEVARKADELVERTAIIAEAVKHEAAIKADIAANASEAALQEVLKRFDTFEAVVNNHGKDT